jgi:NAD(P)-dependent dehydrogenase (short-subunit alcohol dehydrogenase family)
MPQKVAVFGGTSGVGAAVVPGTVGLAAINGAIEAAVHTLARELAPLRVNAVAPGVIDTPWWDRKPREAKERHFQRARDGLPVRRVGVPEGVAAAIILCVRNPFMTGSVVDVAGGAQLP